MRITKMSGNNEKTMQKTIDRQKWKRYSESKKQSVSEKILQKAFSRHVLVKGRDQ